jgi:hypothetical protein
MVSTACYSRSSTVLRCADCASLAVKGQREERERVERGLLTD